MANNVQSFSRLPDSVSPSNYNIWLKPCFKSFTFAGRVEASVKVNSATDTILLNSAEVKPSSAEFCMQDQVITANSMSCDEKKETMTLKFGKSLTIGEGVLKISFEGILNDKMKGFYRNQYESNGEKKFGAVTQFEATDARRCFPCWDEPALKATFDVTLVVPKELCALSNMNIIAEDEYKEDANWKVIKYDTTPIMSTYLLAFVIGEFDFIEDHSSRGIPVRVYAPKGKSYRGQFALNVAVKALQYYEEYFKIPYPLPKVDLIAIADFCAGAMENWGLITYRETALLIDDANSSAHARQWVSLVVCHELAHQWFGNLVTMEWWTHLWLNEGFATFMEYLATDHCLPEYNIWTQFISHDFKRALDLDAVDNSHPIEVPVNHPDEIDEIFDVISYSKGASIIGMLYNWIGDDCFRKGMHDYLTKHSYKNAATEDLWDALAKASDKPVRKVMESWTKQMGFPVISASSSCLSEGSVTLKLTQRKFSARQKSTISGERTSWSIPLIVSTPKSAHASACRALMEKDADEVNVPDVPKGGWIKLNSRCCGFYRVQYDKEMLEALLGAVESNSLTDLDRLNLVNDLFALASSGVSSTENFLKSLKSFKNESSYPVWSDLDCNIGELSVLMWDAGEVYTKFKAFVLTLYAGIANKLGWDAKPGEGHLDAMLRSMIIRRIGRFGHVETIVEAKRRFQDHISGKQSLSADLRSPVYQIVLANSEGDELDDLIRLHDTSDLHEEKERIERSLGCVSGNDKLQRVLKFAMSDKVRSNDKVFVIGSVATGSSAGRNLAWQFVKTNWEQLHDLYKGSFLIARLVKITTENFTTEDQAKDVKTFFDAHPPAAAERTVRQSLDSIQKYAEWWARDGDVISQWFAK